MARENYSIDEVLISLSKKHDILIENDKIYVLRPEITDKEGNKIPNPKAKFDLGNQSCEKIDFLTHYCGYHQFLLNQF